MKVLKIKSAFTLLMLVVASITFAQCSSSNKDTTETSYTNGTGAASDVVETNDIIDVAVSNEAFSTLVTAVKAAGLVDALKGDGPFTVFAPTNDAFGKLPEGTVASLVEPENKELLTSILTYHVIPAKLDSKAVLAAIEAGNGTATVTTLAGGKLQAMVVDGGVVLKDENGNMSKVVTVDVEASNGVIHVIDTVVMPK